MAEQSYMDDILGEDMKCSDNEEEKIDMELKNSIDDDGDTHADPLQESSSVSCNFPWLFRDEDILKNVEQVSDIVLKPGKVRGKRGRPPSKNNSNNNSFLSSNGHAWSIEQDISTLAQDELLLPKQQACGKGPARNVSNAVESWMLLFDDDLLRMLLHLVNDQIQKKRTKTRIERPTDLTELRSWLGLCYLCGVFRNAQYNGPLEELWTLELGNAIFRATMSLPRFQFISECLNKHNNSSSNDALRLWNKMLINCRSYYGPSGWLCVDALPALVDDTPLPICCDAKTLYMTNALHDGESMTPYKELVHLVCDFKTTGRNITLGSRYASLKHAETLLGHNLGSICTLNATSMDYPKNWSAGGVLYSGGGVKRLTTESGNAVLSCGLSTQWNPLQVKQQTFQSCAQFYELANRYSTALSLPAPLAIGETSKLLQLLHFMLNTSAINAWILLRLSPKGDPKMEQRDFQRQLGLFLTQQRLQRRLHRRATTTTLVMRLQICEILGQSSQRFLREATDNAQAAQNLGVISLAQAKVPDGVSLVSRYGEKHRRCKPCARNKRATKARSRCQQCQTHRCGNHLISRCYDCMGLNDAQLPEGNMKDTP